MKFSQGSESLFGGCQKDKDMEKERVATATRVVDVYSNNEAPQALAGLASTGSALGLLLRSTSSRRRILHSISVTRGL